MFENLASSSQSVSYSLSDFLQLDMKNKVSDVQYNVMIVDIVQVITSLVIPFSTANTVMRTFKVMPRHQVGMEVLLHHC